MKKIVSNFAVLGLLMLIFMLQSCGDNCDEPQEGETFTLSDSVKSYISNYENAERIIFTNELGNEVAFEVSDLQNSNTEYQYGGTCGEDASKGQTVKGTSQFMQLFLFNPTEISKPIYISLSEIPLGTNRDDVKEFINITSGEWLSDETEEGDALLWFNLTGTNDFSIFHDSLEISGKKFYSVYEPMNATPTPKLDIKYTLNEGVVYIGDSNSGKELIYERKE